MKTDTNTIISSLLAIKPGETIEYFRGELGREREMAMQGSHLQSELELLCKVVWEMHETGRAALFQRRVQKGKFGFESVYLALGLTDVVAKKLDAVSDLHK